MLKEAIKTSIREGRKTSDARVDILEELERKPRTIVVLDDDPTGTQTVHNVPVVTDWTAHTLEVEMKRSPIFFILTNSRSLQAEDADGLGRLLGRRLGELAAKLNKRLVLISRSDSTLRGHYPNEVDALKEGLGWKNAKELLAPAFFAGGRYTFQNVHYVREGDSFTPVAETPFAQDHTFGYSSSNLKDWINEKTKGKVSKEHIGSFALHEIRNHTERLSEVLGQSKSHFIVNATHAHDLQKVALSCLQQDQRIIYRTGASFVNAITGILPKKVEIDSLLDSSRHGNGGLLIVGSYVPKTTAQLNYLKEHHDNLHFQEFSVDTIHHSSTFQNQIERLSDTINTLVGDGKHVVLYTSRKVKAGRTKEESLKIVNRVSSGLVSIVQRMERKPAYIIAKGGITSSDIAVKGLGVKRAVVLGQALDGVPVWLLDAQSKFPNMPYFVFPGNVGGDNAIHQLIRTLA